MKEVGNFIVCQNLHFIIKDTPLYLFKITVEKLPSSIINPAIILNQAARSEFEISLEKLKLFGGSAPGKYVLDTTA